MPGNIGPLEIAVVLIIVLLIFGPKRLPELGRSIGRGIREFRSSIGGRADKDDADDERRRELEAAQGSDAAAESETTSAGAGVTPGASTEPSGGDETPGESSRSQGESSASGERPAGSVEGEVVTDKRA